MTASNLEEFNIGDRVSITNDTSKLPMPQHLYAGLEGTVKSIGAHYIFVAPDDAAGADAVGGAPFLPKELTINRQKGA